MATSCSQIHTIKPLLVWRMPISDRIAVLFGMIFIDIFDLIKYVSKEIKKSDTFHLIIPMDCLEDILNDPIYEFPQVQRIDVYCEDIDDFIRIKHRFNLECGKLRFYHIYELLESLKSTELDNALDPSNPHDRNTINAILSSIEDRIIAKRSITSAHRLQLLKKSVPTILYGLPVKNINNINSSYICSTCGLFSQRLYKLHCGHQKCHVCLHIQKSCTTCFKLISYDMVYFEENLQRSAQNLIISCLYCQWTGRSDTCQEHLKENHPEIFTCLVGNFQANVNNCHRFYRTEINQQVFLDSSSLLNSDLSMISLNGTCIWEISGIDALRNNVATNPSKSIYSSPFYLFPKGYKICLRIFLNGDVKARGTHMSLFFVLMQGDYDTHLRWPFKFKIIFTLINHLLSNDNQSVSFLPDTVSTSFQCPRSGMNNPYGVSKCFSLNVLKENQNQYVKDDKIFIKMVVDFFAETNSSSPSGGGELPNEEECVDETYVNLSCLLRE